MEKHNEIVNAIPVRTWNWLGVNETAMPVAFPVVKAYRKQPLVLTGEKSVTITSLKDSQIQLQQLGPLPKAGVSDTMNRLVAEHANNGYFIETTAGQKCQTPLLLHYHLDEADPVLVDRQVILARENSEITVVIRYTSQAGTAAYHSGITQVVAQAGAVVHLVKVQLLADDAYQMDAVGVVSGDNGQVDCTLVELGACQTITNCQTQLVGARSAGSIQSIYFGDKDRSIDINHVLTHQARQSVGEIKARGALLDRSRKIFRGTLDFLKGARGAKGKEEEYAVLLSPDVRNWSVPLMLCGEESVEGQHAASAGKVDENKLFYLMSRGLSENEAKKLIIEASFEPILARIPVEQLKEEISSYVKGRLAYVQ
ncbi:Fe-S cluster assembly protein SufD [Propionispora vibrioides]|uniref:Iron-regulated ABC transporter permease protein SufD n=1 Tax=Propionispora vibrioides TaxID=112903 RepID=A0A1H8VSJ6_9FIRM|nr:Fe-S cluster assembly protein SufD [Propionispora vibrioides]SEP18371.1 Iron-regulated ABC transporter permease protein SufD [Propionispora vibrioides]